MRAHFLGLAMFGMLAACGGGGEEAANEAAPGLESATNTPRASPGLWAMSMSGEGMPSMSIKTCFGEDSDGMAGMQGVNPDACSEQRITRTATGWSVHAVCAAEGGMTTTVDQDFSGDPASHLTVKIRSVTTGGAADGGITQSMTMEMTREGECPEGMAPGSVDTGSMIIDGSQMKVPST